MQAIHNSHLAAKHAKTEWVARHEQRLQALSVELRRSVHEQQSTSASRPARGTNPRRSGALYADCTAGTAGLGRSVAGRSSEGKIISLVDTLCKPCLAVFQDAEAAASIGLWMHIPWCAQLVSAAWSFATGNLRASQGDVYHWGAPHADGAAVSSNLGAVTIM